MNVYSAIILCFIPVITFSILLKILAEDISVIKECIACAIGLLALIPITVFQFIAGDFFIIGNQTFLSLLFRALFLYGLIEEGFKCGALFLFPMKNVNLKQVFFYSILAGMFLGSFESVIYLLKSIQTASSHSGQVLLNMIYLRTFTSIVIHSFCAGLLGMFVYSVKKGTVKWSSLIYGIFLHGLYDFFVIMPSPMNAFSYVLILLLVLECRICYVRIKELNS